MLNRSIPFAARPRSHRGIRFLVLSCGLLTAAVVSLAADSPDSPPANPTSTPPVRGSVQDSHPLDPALKIARERLEYLQQHVEGYTCTIVKRERVKDSLSDFQYMEAKVRHQRKADGKVVTPFSVYLKFVKPPAVAGREVIWVDGQNGGNMIVHEAGLLNVKRLSLAPNGLLAMMGQRYPISKIGMLNLVEELIQKGERDRKHDECTVQFFKKAMINQRPCVMIQVIHPEPRDHFDFHKVQIFIDEELQVPVRYAAWHWPTEPGGEPPLLEEYTYLDVKLNPGLTDKDFDPNNPAYNYPSL